MTPRSRSESPKGAEWDAVEQALAAWHTAEEPGRYRTIATTDNSAAEVFAQPRSDYTRALMAAAFPAAQAAE